MQKSQRFHELDSLRGLAALSVVFGHFHDVYFPEERYHLLAPAQKYFVYVLSPFYRGGEAVFLFFALSGFVLSLPYTARKQQPYPIFLLRRIVRLYGPYFVALLIAVAGAAAFHRDWEIGAGMTAQTWTQPFNLKLVLQHVLFVGDYNYHQFNPAFWSLIVEMRVSILFPLLAILIMRMRPVWAILLAAALFLAEHILVHPFPQLDFTMRTVAAISSFILGILLAIHMEDVRRVYDGLRRPSRIALALFSAFCYFFGHFLEKKFHFSGLLQLIGSVGIIAVALCAARVRSILLHPIPMYLGRISYSLYLIHIPILLSLTALLMNRWSKWGIFFVYVPAAILAGALFCKAVEEPCIAWSRRIGSRAAQPQAPPAVVPTANAG